MFENSGSKLKSLSKVVFAVMLIVSLGGALATGILVGKAAAYSCGSGYYSHHDDDSAGFFAGAGIFLAISIGGFFSAYVASSALYGIGESVENSEAAKKAAEQNRAILLKLTGAPAADGKNPSAAKSAAKPVFKPDAAPDAKEDAPAPIDNTKMRCPKCGAVQPKGRSVCWDCSFRFEEAPASDVWVCPSCGRKNKGNDVCWDCGAKRGENPAPEEWLCRKCGTKNEADARFCLRCGTPKA